MNAATLKEYLSEYSKVERARLVVEIEPGQSSRAGLLRRLLDKSNLCTRRRCVEAAWNTKRQVVY